MSRPLRYTGCWPPAAVLGEYPNWVWALDEEGEPDQDETTVKPESQQAYVSLETMLTAVEIEFAGGERAVGILVLFDGEPDSVHYFDGNDWASLAMEGDVEATVRSVLPTRDDQHISFALPRTTRKKPWYKFWCDLTPPAAGGILK